MIKSRVEYWKIMAVMIVIFLLVQPIPNFIVHSLPEILAIILIGGGAWIFFSVFWTTQRFQDVGLSGAWIVLCLVPIIGQLALIVITLLPANTFHSYKVKEVE